MCHKLNQMTADKQTSQTMFFLISSWKLFFLTRIMEY